jgi:CRP/FNR family cyclic AMP-dependent transcriptional regulator
MNPTEIKQALEHCEFFERLEKNDISEIAGLCQVITYEGGEYVFQQGDYGESIFMLLFRVAYTL